MMKETIWDMKIPQGKYFFSKIFFFIVVVYLLIKFLLIHRLLDSEFIPGEEFVEGG